jgi:hypothetical protein
MRTRCSVNQTILVEQCGPQVHIWEPHSRQGLKKSESKQISPSDHEYLSICNSRYLLFTTITSEHMVKEVCKQILKFLLFWECAKTCTIEIRGTGTACTVTYWLAETGARFGFEICQRNLINTINKQQNAYSMQTEQMLVKTAIHHASNIMTS